MKFALHHKKRRLRNLTHKLNKLLADKDRGIIRLCFGAKKLFKAQHYLQENRYSDHSQWLKAWRGARNSQFFALGSKDESFGNQNCTYDLQNTLKLRVTGRYINRYGKHITLDNITFPYGQEQLDKAKHFKIVYDRKGRKRKEFKAVSYRFFRKKDRWYIAASLEPEYPKTKTSTQNGIIALDLNAGFITAVELDRFGNPLNETNYPVQVYSRSSDQVEAALGDAIKAIVELAEQKDKHTGIEKLDFTKKKQQLGEAGTKYARMLSGFVYSKFHSMVRSRALREGVGLIAENMFATSLAGHFRFMARYGLSSHGAAACAIGRRCLGFKLEKPVKDTVIPLPELKRNKNRYSHWGTISHSLKSKKSIPFNVRIAMISADR